MGLDLTAYRGLKKVENPVLDSDGNPIPWETHCKPNVTSEQESHWPGRAAGLEKDTVYTYADSFGFRGGSYGGYNEWRRWLAGIAGYKSDKDCWENHTSGPFFELIDFSDCEGTIGPLVAAKLVKDFADFKEKAQGDGYPDSEYNFKKYCEWEKAFIMAADNGAVDFH